MTVLRGVDRAGFAVAFASRLRAAGVHVGFTAIDDFVRALSAAPPPSRDRLYWTARVCLVRRHTDLPGFDAVFAAVFADAVLALDPNTRRSPPDRRPGSGDVNARVPRGRGAGTADSGLPWATLPAVVGTADEAGVTAVAVPERLPTAVAGLADTPFELLDPAEMQLLGRWLSTAVRGWPTRRSRRLRPVRNGHRVAFRPTVAKARRTAWEPIELGYARPIDKPRRVVMLCDVSKSMQAQATAYLHFMRALALGVDAEVFAFATTLTRLTTQLAQRSAEQAIEQASVKVADRFGGTRIARNVHALLSSHHRDAVRGAVVIIGSDGWDSDPPEQLATAMQRLRRRAY
ncbi:MAG TPA: VWA domain-containing protein, partial [Jatrophihabitans sp.]|nr:VWA domain-containing protein [Jatrophihabitans sp.]